MTLATGVLFLAQVLGHLVVERLFDQLTFGCFTRTINCINLWFNRLNVLRTFSLLKLTMFVQQVRNT
ncbi:hypothetical protein Xthr_15700 [Xanthomonas citri pv. thirumalacharii]|nr:hypothetical protein [Xanthomonas citri pv. thirumalacharii]